jgi:hypothetical protein
VAIVVVSEPRVVARVQDDLPELGRKVHEHFVAVAGDVRDAAFGCFLRAGLQLIRGSVSGGGFVRRFICGGRRVRIGCEPLALPGTALPSALASAGGSIRMDLTTLRCMSVLPGVYCTEMCLPLSEEQGVEPAGGGEAGVVDSFTPESIWS